MAYMGEPSQWHPADTKIVGGTHAFLQCILFVLFGAMLNL